MKQIKIVDVKKALNVNDNNELVRLIMCNLLNSATLFNKYERKDLQRIFEKKWNNLYNLLDEIGYFDDCK